MGESEMKLKRIGIDLAKSVFQVHGVDSHERVVVRKQLRRKQLMEFIEKLEGPTLIAMEACAGAHHWGREFERLGHQVKLIAPQFVKPYVKSGKNDAHDAEAICEAASRPSMRYVGLKSAEAQAVQALHRIRSRQVRARTALVNEARGLLAEFGLVEAKLGIAVLRKWIPKLLEDSANGLPGLMRQLLRGLYEELVADEGIEQLDEQLKGQAKADERVQRLLQIEGVGPISASAVVAAIGDAKAFASGRDLAAALGLVPNQHGTGGKNKLGAISKRGDAYLRCLLIHGARAMVNACLRAKKTDRRSRWIGALVARRNKNIATVALANKNARIIWAMLTREENYRPAV
jgi:transposase